MTARTDIRSVSVQFAGNERGRPQASSQESTFCLGDGRMGSLGTAQRRTENTSCVPGGTDIGGPCSQRRCPHLFIREPVGAYNRNAWELVVQFLHLRQTGQFHINDNDIRPVFSNRKTKFVYRARHMHGLKLTAKTGDKGLSDSGIALKED